MDSGPDRPHRLTLAVAGTPIGFEANARTVEHPDGQRTLVWTVRNVGQGFLSVQWANGKSFSHKVPGYRFADTAERAAVLALIDEALRVYSDSNGLGVGVTPVVDIVFEASAKGT